MQSDIHKVDIKTVTGLWWFSQEGYIGYIVFSNLLVFYYKRNKQVAKKMLLATGPIANGAAARRDAPRFGRGALDVAAALLSSWGGKRRASTGWRALGVRGRCCGPRQIQSKSFRILFSRPHTDYHRSNCAAVFVRGGMDRLLAASGPSDAGKTMDEDIAPAVLTSALAVIACALFLAGAFVWLFQSAALPFVDLFRLANSGHNNIHNCPLFFFL